MRAGSRPTHVGWRRAQRRPTILRHLVVGLRCSAARSATWKARCEGSQVRGERKRGAGRHVGWRRAQRRPTIFRHLVVGLRCARPHPTVLWWVFAASTAPYGFVVGLRCARPHPTVLWWVFAALDRTLRFCGGSSLRSTAPYRSFRMPTIQNAPQHHHFAKNENQPARVTRKLLDRISLFPKMKACPQ